MDIILDHSKCIGVGICESIAPRYFETNEDGSTTVLQSSVDETDRAVIEDAVQACPTLALRLAVDRP